MIRTDLLPLGFAAVSLLAALAPAQHTILMTSGSSDENTLGLDAFELDLIANDEVYEVTPLPGTFYTAKPFLPNGLAWFYLGDVDNDGTYVDASVDAPHGRIDAIFVKATTPAPVTPRDVFFSINATSANFPGVTTSDVVRYAAQGVREVFLSDAVLQVGVGGTSLNLDSLAQSAAGDLFLSFAGSETLAFGSALDGDVLMIPGSAITYDGNGNVASILPGSVVRVATEAGLIAMVNNSGFRTSVGGTVTTSFQLSGLEIDPNGGTFPASFDPSVQVPNLLFVWSDFSNDGAIVSTAGGGSIAVINGVPMGSTIATQGDQLGWLPDSTGTNGPGGLALVPFQAPTPTMHNYPRNLHTAGSGQTVIQWQTSGGTPFGTTVVGLSLEANTPGGTFPSLSGAPYFGELGLSSPILIGFFPNDGLGNTITPLLVLSTTLFAGTNLAVQALDLGTGILSTPAGISFL